MKNMNKTIDSNVESPWHYNQIAGVECIEVIDKLGFNFNLGNALKYLWRCEYKGKKIEDLKKAVNYINREIAKEVSREEEKNSVK